MFKPAVKSELCQISLTGMRSLVLMGLLLQRPRSLEEIRDEFLKMNLIEENTSTDILRIDLNTLRAMGCEISRAGKNTNRKYVIEKTPFSLDISSEEVSILKKVYKKIRDNLDVKTLYEYDCLFRKISEYVIDEDVKQAILGISVLKTFNYKYFNELLDACSKSKTLTLVYKSPALQDKEEIVVFAKNLVLENEKIYLHGFDMNLKQAISLNIKRILSILSSKESSNFEIRPVTIKFHLKEFGVTGLWHNEKIIEQSADGYIIEGEYHNDFLATQRILSLGSDCTVIEPENFKENLINLLKSMKEIYRNE